MAAGECRALFGPHAPADLQRLVELPKARADGGELVAVSAVFLLVPTGAEAALEPAVADMVQAGGHLRDQRRMPVVVAGDQGAEADARCFARQRRHERPAF